MITHGEMAICYNDVLTIGIYLNAIQNFYTQLLREFRHAYNFYFLID